jgi:hypothetical protein
VLTAAGLGDEASPIGRITLRNPTSESISVIE